MPPPHPQGPDGVQILGRNDTLLGDGLAVSAPEGLACNELVRESTMLWDPGEGGQKRRGGDPHGREGAAPLRSLGAGFLLDSR